MSKNTKNLFFIVWESQILFFCHFRIGMRPLQKDAPRLPVQGAPIVGSGEPRVAEL